MSVPDGYKNQEQIAVDLNVPLGRIQAAVKALNIVQTVFPSDQRRRYYSPQDVERIKEWVKNR